MSNHRANRGVLLFRYNTHSMTAAPNSLRPLLRMPSREIPSTAQLLETGYGGVIVCISQLQQNLNESQDSITKSWQEFQSAGLEIWLDASLLQFGAREDLRRFELRFSGESTLEVSFAASASTLLCPFHTNSADFISARIALFAEIITGVLYEPKWRDAIHSLLPEFPWTAALAENWNSEKLSALVSNRDARAAMQRQQYWNDLHQLFESHLNRLDAWCQTKNLAFVARRFPLECEALQPDEKLRGRYESLILQERNQPGWPPLLPVENFQKSLMEAQHFIHAGAKRFQVAYPNENQGGAFSTGAKIFNDALTNHCLLQNDSTNDARVAVLFPTRSCQTHYHPDGHRFTRWISEDLQRVTSLLDELHFDWRLTSEEADWQNDDAIELFIIAGASALLQKTWQKLEVWIKNGGKAACLGLLPRWNENGRDAKFEKEIGKTALVLVEDLYDAYTSQEDGLAQPPTIGFPVFREFENGGRLCTYQPRLNPDAEDARLRVHQILHESIKPDLETQTQTAFYNHRLTTNSDLFFIFNTVPTPQHLNLRLQLDAASEYSPLSLFTIDVLNGTRKPLPVWLHHPALHGGGINISLELAGGEARWIEILNPDDGADHHLESATFAVESFDGKTANGFAIESGIQRVAIRRSEKLQWFGDALVEVPDAILLEDWNQNSQQVQEYSRRVVLPANRNFDKWFLEVAGVIGAMQLFVNEKAVGTLIAAPYRFELSQFQDLFDAGDFELKLRLCEDPDDEIIARLVALPKINIAT